MIKVIDYGNTLKRSKSYYSVTCNHCGAKLVFEYNDIWFDQPMEGIGRVECPVCKTKVFMNFDMIGLPYVCKPSQTTADEYEHAYKDTSKRGIQLLMDEKKKEEVYNENANR